MLILCVPVLRLIHSLIRCVITQHKHGYILIPSVHQLLQCLQLVLLLLPVLLNATAPTPPVVTDNCGRTLTVSAGVPGADPVCAGTKTYTFTYTLCDNTTQTWVYTYTISAPTVTMPAAGASTVACLAECNCTNTTSCYLITAEEH